MGAIARDERLNPHVPGAPVSLDWTTRVLWLAITFSPSLPYSPENVEKVQAALPE